MGGSLLSRETYYRKYDRTEEELKRLRKEVVSLKNHIRFIYGWTRDHGILHDSGADKNDRG
jgi:hypothetical protein